MTALRDRADAGVPARLPDTVGIPLPSDHPQRVELNDEVHARPSPAVSAPARVTCLALLSRAIDRDDEWEQVAALARRFDAPPPRRGGYQHQVDLGPLRLVWERHTEFSRYVFVAPGCDPDNPFGEPAMSAVPADWVAGLTGQVMVAIHAALMPAEDITADLDAIAARHFSGNVLAGSEIADGEAVALTDLRIHEDGFSRLLVKDRGMGPQQAGRAMARLLDMETYRVMALLALPVARDLTPILSERERELAEITLSLTRAGAADEPSLLDRLTQLDAEIENQEALHHYRFSAASAYYAIVQRRIAALREERLPGLQTFQEFTERRLAPAMNTCQAIAERQDSLSRRVARATQLLSTRISITRQNQNRDLLDSMDRRAKLQLRLQETVEGLSVAAITYYIVGLVGYGAKAAESAGFALDPNVVVGASIPVVAGLVFIAVRKARRLVSRGGPY